MPPSKTEKELSKLSTLLLAWDDDWRNARPSFDDWKNDYLAYKMYRDPNTHPYKYNPVVPLVFTIVENTVSTTFNTFFMKETPFQITPGTGDQFTNDEAISRQLERGMNRLVMHPDLEFKNEKYDLDMETATFGNGYTMTVPEFDFDREDVEIGGPLYIGPRVKHISIWDMIPDKDCYRLTKGGNCRRLWHKEWISTEEYKRRVEYAGYKKLDDDMLKKLASDKTWIDENEYHEDLKSKLGIGARPEDGFDDKNGNILLLHYYDMDTGHYTTIASNRTIVRDTSEKRTIQTPLGPISMALKPYPYCPYNDIRLWPFPKEFFARGIGRIARGFQDDINLLKSMRLDELELGIFKPLLVNELMVDELDDLVMGPNFIWPVKDVDNAVKQVPISDVTQNAYTEQGMWEKEAQEATGNFEHMRGAETARRETATMGVMLRQGGAKRQESFMGRIGLWAESVGMKIAIQMRTYMSQTEYERLIGEPDAGFFNLTIDQIKSTFDIKPSASALTADRDRDQQNFINALQMAQGAPQYMNIPEWMKLGFELFFPTKNPDKYILQAPPGQPPVPGGPPPAGPDQSHIPGQPTIDPSQLIDMAAQGNLGG